MLPPWVVEAKQKHQKYPDPASSATATANRALPVVHGSLSWLATDHLITDGKLSGGVQTPQRRSSAFPFRTSTMSAWVCNKVNTNGLSYVRRGSKRYARKPTFCDQAPKKS